MSMALPPLFERQNFPSYIKDVSIKDIQVYWYQPDFTQSRYPPGQEFSEACTLICLLIAQRICQSGLQILSIEKSLNLTILIAEAMIEGNATHRCIVKRRLVPHPYLNTDEALKFGGKQMKTLKEWKFKVFEENIEKNLYTNIQKFLTDWYQQPLADTLIMLLITCGRTVLFIFQEKTRNIILIDSHSHTTAKSYSHGLVIAQAKLEKLSLLCDWYINSVLYNCFNVHPNHYELAFLHYSKLDMFQV